MYLLICLVTEHMQHNIAVNNALNCVRRGFKSLFHVTNVIVYISSFDIICSVPLGYWQRRKTNYSLAR